jgi:peptidoglycan/xylan/chitin deacetylase (PgdA/CDA1 family)
VRALRIVPAILLLGGCATLGLESRSVAGSSGATVVGESDDFVVVVPSREETSQALARTYLGDVSKAWMIEDFASGRRAFKAGERVVVPKRPWNLSGVEAYGYQLVPILVYHNLGPQSKGRLVLGADGFAEQMGYLKREGYRVVTLSEFVEWVNLKRQLPRKCVVLTFDDGYHAFRDYAYPVLKQLGFAATLFVYTDYVGTSRNALSWDELKSLVAEGFDVQAHSKTHSDLRRGVGETDAQYARRMQAELADPPRLFQRQLGRGVQFLAYPYGRVDDDLVLRVREQGYAAAFTVRRESNPSFVRPLEINRSQIYAEMTLEQFGKNLNLFHHENLR